MADYYLDSSALVKRYIREIGSSWVSRLFDTQSNNQIFIVRITCVEIVAAFVRRSRGKSISPGRAKAAINLFLSDIKTDYQIVEFTEVVGNRAIMLAEKHGLRGYDTVQLAAACEINGYATANGFPPLTFVSADAELNAAALNEGLLVDNPTNYP